MTFFFSTFQIYFGRFLKSFSFLNEFRSVINICSYVGLHFNSKCHFIFSTTQKHKISRSKNTLFFKFYQTSSKRLQKKGGERRWHGAQRLLGDKRNAGIFLLMWHFTLTLNEMSGSINDPDLARCNEGNPSLLSAVPPSAPSPHRFNSPCYV